MSLQETFHNFNTQLKISNLCRMCFSKRHLPQFPKKWIYAKGVS